MYFILEIIIFIARLFPDRQPETIRQEQSEQEKKPDHATTNLLGTAKSTPKPRRDQTTEKVTLGSHDSSENASLERSVIDRSTLINAHGPSPRTAQRSVHLQRFTQPLRPCHPPRPRHATHELQQNSIPTRDTHHQPDHRRNGTVASLSRTNLEQAIVDMVVQAGGASVSATNPRKTLILQNAEPRTQEPTSYTYIYTSQSSISSSESTLVNTPTEAEARSTRPSLGQPSSLHPEGPQEIQEACEPALPTLSSSHPYPEAPVDLEEELESSNGFKFTFGSNYTVLPNVPTAEEADFSRATGEVEGIEESVPQLEAGQPIFSISFDFAGETSRAEAPRRKSNRNDGRGNQNSSRNQSRLLRMSELAYDPAIFDFSRQSQPEEPVRSSLSDVTEDGDSGTLDAGNEPGSRTLGASDANVYAKAAVIDPSLEARYKLLIQSTNTVAELREARDGKTRMTDSEPEDAPSEDISRATRATWAPFPWVEIPVEIKKSPAELMEELPFDWMLPTPPTTRLSDVEGRVGESIRSRYSSAVQDGMHIANMKAWIDSIAPLEKGLNAVKTLKMQPSRATSKAHDSENAEGRTLDGKPLSEAQTEEPESTADGQTQEIKSSSETKITSAPQMDLPPIEEELLSLINGIEKLSLGPSMETAGTAFEEELLSLINGIRDLTLGPSIDVAGKAEKEGKAQVARNSNESDQGHTEDLENLINGIRDLSLGPSVDAAGRHTNESKVQLSGDWNVSGLGQYSPKDLDKGPIFGRFLGTKSEVRDPGFTAKKEWISAPVIEITNETDHKCKKAQGVVMPSKERSTRPVDAERQEQHRTTFPVLISEQQRNTNNPHTTAPPEPSMTQDVTTDQPAVTYSPTETTPQNAVPHQPLEPSPAIPLDHQPPSQTEEVYVSVYSLQGLSYPDAAPKEKYISPFSIRRDRK